MVQFRVLVIISPLSSNFTLPGVPGTLILDFMESCYGQILIETATYSLNVSEQVKVLYQNVEWMATCNLYYN